MPRDVRMRLLGTVVVILMFATVTVYLWVRRPPEGVPLTARGVPFMFGGPWMRSEVRFGRALDSARAAPVQTAALEVLPELLEEDAGDRERPGAYCVGILSGYVISDVAPATLTALRGRDPRWVGAGHCRLRVATGEVTGPGLWPPRGWLLWTTVPEEPAPGQAVVEIGYHMGSEQATVWRCFLSVRDGRWVVDSTAQRWRS